VAGRAEKIPNRRTRYVSLLFMPLLSGSAFAHRSPLFLAGIAGRLRRLALRHRWPLLLPAGERKGERALASDAEK